MVFPGDPGVKTLCFQCRGDSLVKELGSYMFRGKAKR